MCEWVGGVVIMVDISMCMDKECPKCGECYRFKAEHNPFWQSYIDPRQGGDECVYFLPCKKVKGVYREVMDG